MHLLRIWPFCNLACTMHKTKNEKKMDEIRKCPFVSCMQIKILKMNQCISNDDDRYAAIKIALKGLRENDINSILPHIHLHNFKMHTINNIARRLLLSSNGHGDTAVWKAIHAHRKCNQYHSWKFYQFQRFSLSIWWNAVENEFSKEIPNRTFNHRHSRSYQSTNFLDSSVLFTLFRLWIYSTNVLLTAWPLSANIFTKIWAIKTDQRVHGHVSAGVRVCGSWTKLWIKLRANWMRMRAQTESARKRHISSVS